MAVDYLSAINSSGSGLNISQIVTSLVEAETAPEQNSINKNIEAKTLEISALGDVSSEFNKLKTSTASLVNKTKLTTTSASTANTISISTASKAKVFSSDITVSTLATPQTLEFTGFTSQTQSVGSGNITINVGNWITNGTATDIDSIYAANTSISGNNSLGTPISHSNLGGVITIATSAGGNQNMTTFTVVGKDMAGNDMTETITGANGGATATGTKVFKSITSVTPGSTTGTGTVTVGHSAATFGANSDKSSSTVSISSSSDTLASVASSLNAVSGVTANIINKGDGTYSLVVRSDTGVNNALKLTVSEDASNTGLSTFDNSSTNGSKQKSAAADAALIVDGISVNRSSNSITDLFDGYTLDITATTSSSFRVSSALDKDEALATLQTFIDIMNSTRTKLNELTKQKTDGVEGGPLSKNIAVNAIKDRINKITTGPIVGYGNDSMYLSELGVRTERDGTLTINNSTFKSQLDLDSTVFDSIFNTMFSSSSDFLNVEASIATSKPTPGRYGFVYNGSTATLNGSSMTSATDTDGNTYYLSSSTDENIAGVKVTPTQTVSSAYVYYGKSLIDQLTDYVDTVLSASGVIAKSGEALASSVSDLNIDLADVDTRVDSLTKRYKEQFSAMESAVTSLKSTGDYLTNMMDAWSNKD